MIRLKRIFADVIGLKKKSCVLVRPKVVESLGERDIILAD